MSSTPTWELPLPADGQQPWGDDYRAAMMTIASGSCVFNVEVSTGDTLQAFVTNLSGTDDPTMLDMTFAARG